MKRGKDMTGQLSIDFDLTIDSDAALFNMDDICEGETIETCKNCYYLIECHHEYWKTLSKQRQLELDGIIYHGEPAHIYANGIVLDKDIVQQ